MERYHELNIEGKLQIAITKFRLYAHNLNIETGKYANIERQQRLCEQCNMNRIEDCNRFLLVCPKYKTIRQMYFKSYYC